MKRTRERPSRRQEKEAWDAMKNQNLGENLWEDRKLWFVAFVVVLRL